MPQAALPTRRPFSFATASCHLLKACSQRLMRNASGQLAGQGCTLQQWVVLMHIRDGLVLTVADLCRDLNHDSGAMTRLPSTSSSSRNLIQPAAQPRRPARHRTRR